MRRLTHGAALTCALALTLTAAACGGDSVPPLETPNDTTKNGGGGGGGGGTVQRATLTVQVRVAQADASVLAPLGWPGGAVPGAVVVVQRLGSTQADTVQSDAAGTARFEDLLEGSYQVSSLRVLTATERERLAPEDQEVSALAGSRTLQVQAPSTATSVDMDVGRPGSLVFSEITYLYLEPPGVGGYPFWQFIELYNNSDTTIYLDGKLIGSARDDTYDRANFPCSDYEQFTSDAEGLWLQFLYRFPGTGTQYPLAPGRAVVIATDAIDHSEYGGLDLSRAAFEFIGAADVDNPAVPNLVSVGPREYFLDRGFFINALSDKVALIEPLDPASLPRHTIPSTGVEYLRVPADKVLDVFTHRQRTSTSPPFCSRMVHERFDRQPSTGQLAEGTTRTLQRPVLQVLPNGMKVLQRTRTSARDFVAGDPTPGTIP